MLKFLEEKVQDKMYQRIITKRVVTCRKHLNGEEQCGFKSGGGCV